VTDGADRNPPGSSLRYGNPWADPLSERDPVRQARARLPAPVTVWTAGDVSWAGLTVSSVMVAQGEPGRLLGLIGPDTDLAEIIDHTGSFVVHLLVDRPEHRRLARHFAGTLDAAAGLLRTEASSHGPRLLAVPDQLACRVSRRAPSGWSQLVEAEIEDVRLTSPGSEPGLLWCRGDFRHWS
jgi:3-hydroxy-9,10-secoandrosta-1,3,5(10)-triene-9,17-dione monooxygenase reductase component